MIKPTIGRIVHFYEGIKGAEPLAAIVTKVWNDTCINICAFTYAGSTSPMSSIVLVQPNVEPPAQGPYCCWMPYQVKKSHGTESGEVEAGTEVV